MASFFTLQVALSGMRAQQCAMNVTAHNIANAATPGFHRQEALMMPGSPVQNSFALNGRGTPHLGTGALIQSVRRMQSSYIDEQLRSSSQWLGSWNAKNDALKQIEAMLLEPSDLGLSNLLDRFWNSWEELSASPESVAAKAGVVQAGVSVTQRIQTLYGDLRNLHARTEQSLVSNVDRINTLAEEIAEINKRIIQSGSDVNPPNDLLDRRDMLLDDLSKLVDIRIGGDGDELMVSISGKLLIQGPTASRVTTVDDENGLSQPVWENDGTPLRATGGEIAGQLAVRDDMIKSYTDSLDQIARALVDRVNAIYSSGKLPDGSSPGDFFVAGTGASNIAVVPGLVQQPGILCASSTGTTGDNGIALKISAVRDEPLAGGQTLASMYQKLVSAIASDSNEADTRIEAHNTALQQLQLQKESVSGVSLDEEMMNMMKFQHAYNAAARLVTVIDEMISTVVGGMGVAGR